MKAYLQQFIGTAVLGLALFAQNIPAWAGEVSLVEVFVGANSASGSMAAARDSSDSLQYIGCSFSNNGGPFVVCSAKDKAGKSYTCTSTSPALAAAVKAITDFSSIVFGSLDGTASCSGLWVQNFSSHLR
jgi:hypothetical protein